MPETHSAESTVSTDVDCGICELQARPVIDEFFFEKVVERDHVEPAE